MHSWNLSCPIPEGPSFLCLSPTQLQGPAWCWVQGSLWGMSFCAEVGTEAQRQASGGP